MNGIVNDFSMAASFYSDSYRIAFILFVPYFYKIIGLLNNFLNLALSSRLHRKKRKKSVLVLCEV